MSSLEPLVARAVGALGFELADLEISKWAMGYQKFPDCDLVSFAEVVTRDPFLLVGKGERPGFAPADLLALRLEQF